MSIKRPHFRKIKKGLYANAEPPRSFSYKGRMRKRNKSDEKFYKKRYQILVKETEKALLPLLKEAKHRFGNRKLKILDVGCGDGQVFTSFDNLRKRHGFKMEFFGLDVDPIAMEDITLKAHLSKASATKMPYKDDYFEIITSKHVIEHLDSKDVGLALKEIYRVLKPGGIFYCETPNPESLLAKTMDKNWWMFLDEHLTLMSPQILKEKARKAGFESIKATTKAEIDEQIDEVREILQRNPNSILNTLLKPIRHRLLRSILLLTKKASVTIAIAEKGNQACGT